MKNQEKAKRMYERAVEAIEKNNLFFIKDAYTFIGIPESTFYEYIPADSEFSEMLKIAIAKNRAKTKVGLRKKWYNSNSATAQLALYKLICSDEERKALSMEYHDLTTDGEKIELPAWIKAMDD